MPYLGILAVPAALAAFDVNIEFTGRDTIGTVVLNGKAGSLDSNRTDIPQRARFGQFFALAHVGLPNGILSCTRDEWAALRIETPANGFSGYKDSLDTIWSQATFFPPNLSAPDSILDDWNRLSGRNRYQGRGFIHSLDRFLGCSGKFFMTVAGYNRVWYVSNSQGIFAKFQVSGFEWDSTRCGFGPPGSLCPISRNVVIRYHLTADPAGRFREIPSLIRSAVRDKPLVQIWRFNALGRVTRPTAYPQILISVPDSPARTR